MSSRVLVVEDNAELRDLLARGLGEEDFEVDLARNGREALTLGKPGRHDLLVVDIGLPDTDGRDLCRALKSNGVEAPVLFLTAKDSGQDRVSGFTAGGDDYLTKPFLFAELVARLNALVRRTGPFIDKASAGELTLDPVGHTLNSGSLKVDLTPTEFRLAGALVGHSGEVIRRRDLIAAGWPDGAIVHDNTVDVYMRRLRIKLDQLESELGIHTVHGVGYRLQ